MVNSKNTNAHLNYRPDIDGLRAIAVLSVVIFHAFPSLLPGGFIGVDIFFVISGFLISSIVIKTETFSFIDFYRRRVRRIFPALIVVLIAVFIFGWFSLLADEYKQLGKHIAAGASFVSNFVLWDEVNYFDNAAETKPLLHLWSLGIEEQFYIFWPFLLWFILKKNFNVLKITSSLIIFSFGLNVIDPSFTGTFYSPLTRIWELLIGAILAYMFTHKKSLTYSHIFQFNKFEEKLSNISIQPILHLISTIGFILLIVGFISTDGEDYPGWLALIPVLGAALIISSGANAFVNKKILSSKVLVWFGLISYPLYLWHWPLLSFLNIIDGGSVSVEMRITLIAISIILSWLTYKFIENPVRLKGYLSIKFWIILNIVIFIVGIISYKSDGFEFRSTIENHQNNKNELIRTPRMDDSCKQLLDLEKPNFEYCRFSKVNTDDIVALIGDSHAHVAFQGVSEYLIDYGKSTLLLASSGCPSFVLGKNVDVESNYLDCSVRARQIIDILKSRRDVTKVFIFARGPLYYTGWEPLDSVSKPSQDILIDQKHYFEAAQKTIDELVNSGKEVIFVTENPELPFDPKSCIPRPFRNKPSSCSLKKEVVLERLDGYLKSVNSLKNVKVFNSLEVFCPEGECLVFDSGGLLLYADDDHLSVNGSNFQAKKILSHFFKEK